VSRALLALALLAAPAQADDREDPLREEEVAAVFDASPVPVEGRLRIELRAGLAMPEQASRMRLTNPLLGVGFSSRPLERLRLDGGYLFTWANQGTGAVSVLNTHHALNLRGHWLVRAGPTWFSVGAGPALGLLTTHPRIAGRAEPASVSLAPGVAVAGGVETQAGGRLFRLEASAQSRSTRVDLLFLVAVGL
jgi:hypothetical protein